MTSATWDAWCMTASGAPFERRTLPPRRPAPGEVVVQVAGCGVCHTDLSFLYLGVKTRHGLPLVLGHEISGTVREAGEVRIAASSDPAIFGSGVFLHFTFA